MGPEAFCIEYYKECDGVKYIYIYDTTDYTMCTIAENV